MDLGIDEEPASASAAITCDRAVELVGFGSFHVWLTLILTLGNAADAVEVMSIGLVLPNLTHLSDADKGALTAAVFAGALVGAVAWGLAGDLVGRRPALVASLLLNGLSALASSAVGERLGALCACRFFAGSAWRAPTPSRSRSSPSSCRRRGEARGWSSWRAAGCAAPYTPPWWVGSSYRKAGGAFLAAAAAPGARRSRRRRRARAREPPFFVRAGAGAGGRGGPARGLAAHAKQPPTRGLQTARDRRRGKVVRSASFKTRDELILFFLSKARASVFRAVPGARRDLVRAELRVVRHHALAPRGVRARRFLSRNERSRLAARVPGEPARRPRRGARERRQRVFRSTPSDASRRCSSARSARARARWHSRRSRRCRESRETKTPRRRPRVTKKEKEKDDWYTFVLCA